jgi:hypothetical protein
MFNENKKQFLTVKPQQSEHSPQRKYKLWKEKKAH